MSSPSVPATGFRWTWGKRREPCCTIVAKLTFTLKPGESDLSDSPEPISTRPVLDAQATGLLRPPDVAPLKLKVDVFMTGLAYPPGPGPFVAALAVGGLRRVAHCPASSKPLPLPVLPAPETTFMRVDHIDSEADAVGLQDAPESQQCPTLEPSFPITMENLHPRHAHLTTRLKAYSPVARFEDGAIASLPLVLDTLLFDTEAMKCVATYRCWRAIPPRSEEMRVRVELQSGKAPHAAGNNGDAAEAMTKEIVQPGAARALPFAQGSAPADVRKPASLAPVTAPASSGAPSWPAEVASPVSRASAPPLVTEPAPVLVKPPAPVDAKAASDAAAGSASKERPRDGVPRVPRSAEAAPIDRPLDDRFVILWFAPEKAGEIRIAPAIKVARARNPLVAERARAGGLESADERHVAAAFRHGSAALSHDIGTVREDSVDEAGRVTAPLVLAVGELRVLFDERKRLEACIATGNAMFAGTKAFKDALPMPEAALGNTWASAGSLEHATNQLREAVGRISKDSLALLDTQVRRALLEHRAFRTRVVLGEEHLRFDFDVDGTTFPLYLPMAVKNVLPIFESFAARVIAEVHAGVDMFDAPGDSLRACALARTIVSPPARRPG
ncbi:MAG: DUF2169 domain-containing protein [Myxococcales bacterium]|nr:DUF2169 domain-containing protein [Myxococcales bacterium]